MDASTTDAGADEEDDQAFVARRRMAALLSHELRTPLNGVLGMAGLLAATPLDATQSAYLSTLRDCAEHLLGLVNDVLDFAKLESGRIELEPGEVEVERLLQGVCELLSPRAYAGGIEIGWWVAADVPRLRTDDGRLRQILFNLAGNAVKLTRSGGVALSAERLEGEDDGRVQLAFTVRDTGPGLAEDDRRRIFEEFVQTQAGEAAGGAGLGLAIVRRLAEAFGGRVEVESRPGEGARFRLVATFEVAAPAASSAPLAGLRIGVETPSPVLADIAAGQILACGAQVAERTGDADVLLIDLKARDHPPPGGPPALVLLAPEERERIRDLHRRGFAGYLIKPLRRASLAARVQAVLRGPAAGMGEFRRDGRDERAKRDDAGLAAMRVLLVEDNAVNALLARTLLTRSGCTVDSAGDGTQALALAAATPYDLILMDMRMPGMSGLETAQALRARGSTTPIVALTANAFEEDRRACEAAGMAAFLTKPLDPAALAATLARLSPGARAREGLASAID